MVNFSKQAVVHQIMLLRRSFLESMHVMIMLSSLYMEVSYCMLILKYNVMMHLKQLSTFQLNRVQLILLLLQICSLRGVSCILQAVCRPRSGYLELWCYSLCSSLWHGEPDNFFLCSFVCLINK